MGEGDEEARHAIRTCLDQTLFVEAGAGSGKTTSLVERFVALVEDGVAADRIAAITFTEKAASELSDRIRRQLQLRAPASERCTTALDALDRAAICTLHSFALQLLNEHPIEAGLPPRVAVLDEIASQLAFESRWSSFVDRIIEDPDMEHPLRMLLAAGARTDHLRQVAVQFGQNWDLVADRIGGALREVGELKLDPLLSALDEVVAMAPRCSEPSDRLHAKLAELAGWAAELRAAPDEDTRMERLTRSPSFASRVGRSPSWVGIEEVRTRVAALQHLRDRACDQIQQACLERISDEIARFTAQAANARRADGELEYHDLLVLAREMLSDPSHGVDVRSQVAARYERLLLDEFQDTDPIQVEIAVLIASDDPAAATRPWWEAKVKPGRLFFVGDPKQSIYRFRRADISTFLRARDTLGGRVEHLKSNFRSAAPILDWVNHTFDRLIHPDGVSQPAYVPLDKVRPESPVGPGVAFIGCEAHPGGWRAADLREAEASDAAAVVIRAITEGWSVFDSGADQPRPAQWGDVAVLLPARTSLQALERALERAGIPYRTETSSLVYGTTEIRDLLMVARAVEDPTDSLAVVSALRTAGFACGDDDLYTWYRVHRGSWDHQRPPPVGAPVDHVAARALSWLGALHRERVWLLPSQVLERIVRERRLMELAFVQGRPRDLWRRYRFVIDQCRAWEEAGGGTLREYLSWVRLQGAEGSRVIETVLPETDDQAVRILTIHGAKGLEFPITVLSGMTTQLGRRPPGVRVLFPPGDRWAVHLNGDLETSEFSEYLPIEEQMDSHERLRLLYVGATRARDHLVVSVHRKSGARPGSTAADLLYAAGGDSQLVQRITTGRPVQQPARPELPLAMQPGGGRGGSSGLPSLPAWEVERSAILAAATRPVAISATRLAEEVAAAASWQTLDGVKKDARDLDLPPWQKGRYGSAIGRAVHAVLQSADLGSRAGLKEACAAQAAAEGVLGRETLIEELCLCALDSELVRRASARPHWREVYVGAPDGDRVLEGYIDLLFRDDDGLVVVDYKTDGWTSEEDLRSKADRYTVQLQTYASAVEGSLDEPAVRLLLLFLAPGGSARAIEVPIS